MEKYPDFLEKNNNAQNTTCSSSCYLKNYDPETMAIVPKYPTDNMCDVGVVGLPDGIYPDFIYDKMVNVAPQVEPVVSEREVRECPDVQKRLGLVPLSEVLELLRTHIDKPVTFAGKLVKHKVEMIIEEFEKTYGVSE